MMMKRGGGILQEHMKTMIEKSNLVEEECTEKGTMLILLY